MKNSLRSLLLLLLIPTLHIQATFSPSLQENESRTDLINYAPTEVTLIMIKPEVLARGKEADLIGDLEIFCTNNALSILEIKELLLTKELLQNHYFGNGKDHAEKVGYKVIKDLRNAGIWEQFQMYTPIELGELVYNAHINGYKDKTALVVIIAGPQSVEKIAKLKGATNPMEATSDTLRSKFSSSMSIYQVITQNKPFDNAVHTPDNREEVAKDMRILLNTTPEEYLTKFER